MAVLPGERFLIQQSNGTVMLFDTYDDRILVTFNPADANAVAQAQKHIHDLEELDAEQKCFAHLWSGYFYAHATMERDHIPTAIPDMINLDLDGPYDPDTEVAITEAMDLVTKQVEKPRTNLGSSGPPGRID
jgi:hypothetical protein